MKGGYYNGLKFHWVVQGYVQTGDPDGDGTGGTSFEGEPFQDEFSEALNFSEPFLVCMANKGPNTNTSQFFITTIPSPWLKNRHTIFGKVAQGTEVVRSIEKTKTDHLERPLVDIHI